MDKFIDKFVRYLEIEKNYSAHTITNYKLDLQGFNKFIFGAGESSFAFIL